MSLRLISQVIFLVFILVGTHARAADFPGEALGRIHAVMSLWEYEREEFNRLSKINDQQSRTLQIRLGQEQDPKIRRGIGLLLALNCGKGVSVSTPFAFLYTYRCENGSFRNFAAKASMGMDSFYAIAFVKPPDRAAAIAFLGRYIEFWKNEARRRDGLSIGESDLELLLEISKYLEQGGYQ